MQTDAFVARLNPEAGTWRSALPSGAAGGSKEIYQPKADAQGSLVAAGNFDAPVWVAGADMLRFQDTVNFYSRPSS